MAFFNASIDGEALISKVKVSNETIHLIINWTVRQIIAWTIL